MFLKFFLNWDEKNSCKKILGVEYILHVYILLLIKYRTYVLSVHTTYYNKYYYHNYRHNKMFYF